MKISLNWLKDYVIPGISTEKLLERLTMAGLEVEKQEVVGGDIVFEMEITPNRSDCLSFLGIAREVAVVLNKPLKEPKIKKHGFGDKKCSVAINDKKSCHRYIGSIIENVNVRPSPAWLKRKLESVGLRSVNNIVDITNYCMLELGQPLHAFDYDKLIGGKVIVRRAINGEVLKTINDQHLELDPNILVIADEKSPVAVAGIMGGKDTEVSVKTKNILLESAHFDPIFIRRTSRKLAISTESSYRFERGIDKNLIEKCADRAISLILENAGGKLVKRSNVVVPAKNKKSGPIETSVDNINGRLGATIAAKKIKQILSGLGMNVSFKKNNFISVNPPQFRPDLKQEVDIIEEVARVIGYDRLPLSMPHIKASGIAENKNRAIHTKIKDTLTALGFSEAITLSMISTQQLAKTKQGHLEGIKIKNPLSLDQEIMRPSLMPSFLGAIQHNLNRGAKNLCLFELGKIYRIGKDEKGVVALMATGEMFEDWQNNNREINFYHFKGAVLKVFESLGVSPQSIKESLCEEEYFNGPIQMKILVKDKEAAFLGEVDAEVLKNWSIKNKNIFFAELDIENISGAFSRQKMFRPLVEYPQVVRDISLAVKKGINFQEIRQIVFREGTDILTNVRLIEEYLGEKIPPGQRGLIFSMTFQSTKRTLREEEVNKVHAQICQALINEAKVTIR